MANNTETGLRKTSVKEYADFRGKRKQYFLRQLKAGKSLPYVVRYEMIGKLYILYVNY
jgi:hypothetical protein